MNNRLIPIIAMMALSTPALSASERWTCEVDLHQGETGRLEFDRTESGIRGSMTVGRQSAGGPLAAAIQGSWGREVMRFTRTLAGSGEETFMGIALGTDPGVMKVAGRFGAAFNGVWSATCSNAATDPSAGGSGQGVTPTPPPVPPTRAACNIVVAAGGPRADVAKIFQIIVRGPDSMTAIRARQPFGAGEVSFPNLPDGRYIVTVDTKADIAVNVTPRRHEVVCSGGTVERKAFEFR